MDIFGRETTGNQQSAPDAQGWRSGLMPAVMVFFLAWGLSPQQPHEPANLSKYGNLLREHPSLRKYVDDDYDEEKDVHMQRLHQGGSSQPKVGDAVNRKLILRVDDPPEEKIQFDPPEPSSFLDGLFFEGDEEWANKLTLRAYHQSFKRHADPLLEASLVEKYRKIVRRRHHHHSDVALKVAEFKAKAKSWTKKEESETQEAIEQVYQRRLRLAKEMDETYTPPPVGSRPVPMDFDR